MSTSVAQNWIFVYGLVLLHWEQGWGHIFDRKKASRIAYNFGSRLGRGPGVAHTGSYCFKQFIARNQMLVAFNKQQN